MGVLDDVLGIDPPAPPTTTTQQILSPEQKRLMSLAMPGVEAYAANQPQRYQGTQIAGFDPTQVQAQTMALGAAGQQGILGTNAGNLANWYTSGGTWNPASNAMLRGAQDAAVRPLYQNLLETVLPGIRGDAINVGGIGGSRQGIAEGRAIEGTQRAAGDVSAKLAEDLYRANVQAELSALGLIPQIQQAQLAPAATTGAVGDVRQNLSQRQLDEQVANFYLDQPGFLEYLKSKELLGLAQGLPGGGVQTTGSLPTPNPLAQSAGGALAGAQLGSMLLPGAGTAIGAGAGALLPFLFS